MCLNIHRIDNCLQKVPAINYVVSNFTHVTYCFVMAMNSFHVATMLIHISEKCCCHKCLTWEPYYRNISNSLPGFRKTSAYLPWRHVGTWQHTLQNSYHPKFLYTQVAKQPYYYFPQQRSGEHCMYLAARYRQVKLSKLVLFTHQSVML